MNRRKITTKTFSYNSDIIHSRGGKSLLEVDGHIQRILRKHQKVLSEKETYNERIDCRAYSTFAVGPLQVLNYSFQGGNIFQVLQIVCKKN